MSTLTIVANIKAAPDSVDSVKAALEKLVDVTRKETGCVKYDLHQNNSDPSHFMFYETWTSRELWQQHMKAPHLAEYGKATEGKVIEFTLFEMTQI